MRPRHDVHVASPREKAGNVVQPQLRCALDPLSCFASFANQPLGIARLALLTKIGDCFAVRVGLEAQYIGIVRPPGQHRVQPAALDRRGHMLFKRSAVLQRARPTRSSNAFLFVVIALVDHGCSCLAPALHHEATAAGFGSPWWRPPSHAVARHARCAQRWSLSN